MRTRDEMLLAAKVYELALRMAEDDQREYKDQIKDEENRDALLMKWAEEHPASGYTPRAYALLEKVAGYIDDARAANQSLS
jgi:hypothetical protein